MTAQPDGAAALANAPHAFRRFSDRAIRDAGPALAEFEKSYEAMRKHPDFLAQFTGKSGPLVRRPTPLHFAERFTSKIGSTGRFFFKREDLRHGTPADEYARAQAWLGMKCGRRTLITGNDDDTHSRGLAYSAREFGLQCTVAVRCSDLDRKKALIERLREFGATVETWPEPARAEDDPRDLALQLWLQSEGTAHLALSLGWGPPPYPRIVSDFQSLVGHQVEAQVRGNTSRNLPLTLVSCVGSQSDAIGFMLPFLDNDEVTCAYAEPMPGGPDSWNFGNQAHLYNGARREHNWLLSTGKIKHSPIPDHQAEAMREQVARLENIRLSAEDARSITLAVQMSRRYQERRNYVVLAG